MPRRPGMAPVTSQAQADQPIDRAAIAQWARAKLARRSLAAFVQQAVESGQVPAVKRLEWGPHLDAVCLHTQLQLEGWLVAYELGTADMIQRQREAWERTGATWEDGLPEPWLRYVLVQNEVDNLPPGTFKSTIVMVLANAWIWLLAPGFIWGAASGIDANVTRDSNATRDIVKGTWYRETFAVAWSTFDVDEDGNPIAVDIAIRPDADAVSDWATTAGGAPLLAHGSARLHRAPRRRHVHRRSRRRGSGVERDGPARDAEQVHERDGESRQRRAPDDPQGDAAGRASRGVLGLPALDRALVAAEPKGWAHLCIAAEFGFGPKDAPEETPFGWRDWRTEKGETMHPRLSPGVLADKRLKLPGYNGQYNQNADELGSGMFERKFTRYFVFEGTNIATLRRRFDGCPPMIYGWSATARCAMSPAWPRCGRSWPRSCARGFAGLSATTCPFFAAIVHWLAGPAKCGGSANCSAASAAWR